MRTANPALNDEVFRIETAPAAQVMTLPGTVAKTCISLLILVATAGFTWYKTASVADPSAIMPYILGGGIGGFVVALITVFKPKAAPFTTPLYAVAEGAFLGALSMYFERQYPDIVTQAVGLTFGTLGGLLLAYTSGVIKATEKFKLGIMAATGGIMLVYLASFVLGFFGIPIPMIHEANWIGIGFSLFVVVIAALNLVLDFDFIESGVEHGAPKYMEWYAAFGLLVTLVWLYIEILRLLSKLRDR